MVRKFFVLFAMAIAAAAMMASTAAAQTPVHVEADDMVGITGTNTIAVQVHTGMGESDLIRCENNWEATISEDGAIHVHDINIGPGGATSNCATANDCGAEWDGQIFEDSNGNSKVHLSFCTNKTGPGEVTCDIDANGAHCADVPVEGSAVAEVTGEVSFSEPISITDV